MIRTHKKVLTPHFPLYKKNLSESKSSQENFEDKTTFFSQTVEHKLHCNDDNLKEQFQFLMMVVASVMTLFMSMIQDCLGRKQLLLIGFALALIGWACILFSNSLTIELLGLMTLWGYMDVLNTGIYVLSNELLVNPFRNLSINCYGIIICLGGIFGNFLTHFFQNYKTISTAVFICYLMGFLMLALLLCESPSFLLKSLQHKRLKKVIREIGNANNLSESEIQVALNDVDSVIKCRRFALCNLLRRRNHQKLLFGYEK